MNDNIYSLECGGIRLGYSFLYPETRRFFKDYLKEDKDLSCEKIIRLTPEYLRESRWLVDEEEDSESFLEFQSLMLATGNELLLHDRALFHGASFSWNNLAWIITAPSGTGKTTQLRHWYKFLKKNDCVINGDKPMLVCKDDGSVWVHSSPWKGKEKLGKSGKSARLGGIILLEQGSENRISLISPEESAGQLYVEFVSYPDNRTQILHQRRILETILDTVPVWKLINVGDEKSALLTKQTIEVYLSHKENWHIREGVQLINVHGTYFLVADKGARKYCSYIKQVNEMGSFIWRALVHGKTMEELIKEAQDVYEIPDRETLKTDISRFISMLKEHGYLLTSIEVIEEQEDDV